jgi:hypothetical protein
LRWACCARRLNDAVGGARGHASSFGQRIQRAEAHRCDYASFLGYYAPQGIPPKIVPRLNDAFVKAVASSDAQAFFGRMGMIGVSSTPAQLRQFNQKQIEAWGRLVKIAKMEAQ